MIDVFGRRRLWGKYKKREKKKASLREKGEMTKEESAMSDAILEELKSLPSDLTQRTNAKI